MHKYGIRNVKYKTQTIKKSFVEKKELVMPL